MHIGILKNLTIKFVKYIVTSSHSGYMDGSYGEVEGHALFIMQGSTLSHQLSYRKNALEEAV